MTSHPWSTWEFSANVFFKKHLNLLKLFMYCTMHPLWIPLNQIVNYSPLPERLSHCILLPLPGPSLWTCTDLNKHCTSSSLIWSQTCVQTQQYQVHLSLLHLGSVALITESEHKSETGWKCKVTKKLRKGCNASLWKWFTSLSSTDLFIAFNNNKKCVTFII